MKTRFFIILSIAGLLCFQNCGEALHLDEAAVMSHASSNKATCGPEYVPEYRTSLLTKSEIGYVLSDLFAAETTADPRILRAAREIPEISVDKLANKTMYSENNSAESPSELYLKKLIEISDLLFKRYVLSAEYRTKCTAAAACLAWLERDVVVPLWRRPLTAREHHVFVTIFAANSDSLLTRTNILFLTALASPQFYLKNYIPSDADNSEIQYEQYQLASRISFFLYNSVPDTKLLDAAAQGRLVNRGDLEYQVDRLLQQPQYAARFVKHTLGPWAGIDDDLVSTEDVRNDRGVVLPVATMAQQIFHTLYDMVLRDRPLSEFVFSDSVYMNKATASYIGLNSSPYTAGFQKVSVTADVVGSYFTSPHFTKNTRVNPGSVQTLVSARGMYLSEHFLCIEIPPNELRPEDIMRVLGPNASRLKQTQVGELRRKHPSCLGCHGETDKMGMGLEFVNTFGRIRTQYSDGSPILISFSVSPESGHEVYDLREFLTELSRDERFHSCFLKTIATKVAPLELGRDQGCANDVVNDSIRQGGIREYVKNLVASPLFAQARRTP